jgi:hypothetical protein
MLNVSPERNDGWVGGSMGHAVYGTDPARRAFEPDPGWRFLALARDAERGGWTPRIARPENLGAGAGAAEAAYSEAYWQGAGARWSDLAGAVDAGGAVGVLVERSGLVVLDCDVRRVDAGGFRLRSETSAGWSGATVLRGTRDLERLVGELGRELPRTWRVRTKSGGEHWYFRQNPEIRLPSSGHRDGWLVDVKASANAWVVAPPTPGYSVVEDAPVGVMPDWLARWISELGSRTLPLGGAGRSERSARRVAAGSAFLAARAGLVEPVEGLGLAGMFDAWCSDVLAEVSESNRAGGWNQAVFQGACALFEAGVGAEGGLRALMTAAAPWDGRERRSVVRTVRSAYARVTGRDVSDGFGMEEVGG